MANKVLYFSKGGNTKKVADSIAKAIDLSAETVPVAYPISNVQLLFLGAGLYAGKLDEKMTNYIKILDAKSVRNVALFSTSGNGEGSANKIMRDLLVAKGINVLDKSFSCKGQSFIFLSRKHPDEQDLKNAQDFAKECLESIKA